MGHKIKIRFVASVSGKLRELFWVRELSDGTIIIKDRGERAAVINGKQVALIEDRWTIHLSSKSKNSGTTINNHLRYFGEQPKDTAAYIANTSNFLLFPIYVRRCAILTHQQYDHNPHRKDETIVISQENDENSTLIYVIYLSKPSFEFPQILPYRLIERNFKAFKFGIYVCHENHPPIDFAVRSNFQSSPTRVAGESLGEPFSAGFQSINPKDIGHINYTMIQGCTHAAFSHLRFKFKDDPILLDLIDKHKVLYTTYPISSDSVMVQLVDRLHRHCLPETIPIE